MLRHGTSFHRLPRLNVTADQCSQVKPASGRYFSIAGNGPVILGLGQHRLDQQSLELIFVKASFLLSVASQD